MITVKHGTELVQTLTATRDARTGAYAASAATLPDGTYTAHAAQADDLSHVTTTSARTFVVDTTPPAITHSASPVAMRRTASQTASSPDPQRRFTVTAGTS